MSALTDRHSDALLAAFSVGALAPAEQRAVERHLAGCARCRHRLNSLETTALLLRNLPAPEPPRSFLLPPSTPLRRPAPLLVLPLSFLSAAAVLFLAFGLSLVLNRPSVPTSAARSTAAGHAVQGARSTAVRAFAAATTGVAGISSAAAAARQAPAAAAPPAPPVGATTRTEQTTKESTSSVAKQPASYPPASAPRRYQVLLAIGGAACLLAAALAFLRGRVPPDLA